MAEEVWCKVRKKGQGGAFVSRVRGGTAVSDGGGGKSSAGEDDRTEDKRAEWTDALAGGPPPPNLTILFQTLL